MITLLSSEVGYKNYYLSSSLVLWTFLSYDLNHSLMQKKNQYYKSQRQRDRAKEHFKCQTALSILKKKNPPDKVQEDTSQRSHWEQVCSSSCGQWPCQVCLRVQPRLLAKRVCCDPNIGTFSALPSRLLQSLHLEDAGEEWKFSMILFRFFSQSFFSYLNPPKYTFGIITTKSTCHLYQHKCKWWP